MRHRPAGVVLGVALVLVLPLAGFCTETVESRLLRTVQLGVPQDIGVDEIKKIALDTNHQYLSTMLARAALLVLHQQVTGMDSSDNTLNLALDTLLVGSNADQEAKELAPGFAQKELVYTLVYAMVMSGNQEQAVNCLEKHLPTGGNYKQAVVLQALRNIGTPRAIGLIQKYAEQGDKQNIAENTLADQDFPVLFELHDRWGLVPPDQRNRKQLTAIVNSGCDQRTAMASYWLGFFPPNPNASEEKTELRALRAILDKHSPTCEMMEHIIAMKSLGLRSPESLDYWIALLRSNRNVWERHQAVLIGWGDWGEGFEQPALDLLKTEPTQYIQWELMQGNILLRKRSRFRSRWDIWIPSTLQLYLNFYAPYHENALAENQVSELLSWLESGARPQDQVVSNHMLYALVDHVKGSYTPRLLRLFNQWPNRNQNWWIIDNLNDPRALPLLRYWSTLPTETYQSQVIHNLVTRLEARSRAPAGPISCCEPTRECLIRQIKNPVLAEVTIHSEAEARAWLSQNDGTPSGGGLEIRFVDQLRRIADVELRNGERQRWEYIYDCWHNTSSSK